MKGFWFVLILVGLFSSTHFAQDEKSKNNPDFKSVVESKNLDSHSKSIYQLYSRILPLVNELNQKDISSESIKKIKSDISSLLKKAAKIEANPSIKDYIITLSEDIGSDDFTSSYSKWLVLEKQKIDLIFRFHKKKKKYEVYVLFNNPNYSRAANKYLSFAEKMKTNTITKFSASPAPIKILDQFMIVDLLNSATPGNFVLLHPPMTDNSSGAEKKIIIFRNIARNLFDRIVKPISVNVFDASLNKNVHFKPYFTHLILHQIAHYLGPYFVQAKSEQPALVSKKLKNLFTCIEEVKADAVAICSVSVLKDDKLSSLPGEKRIYTTYVVYLIEKIRSEADDTGKNPYLIQLNFLFKNEGLIFDLNADVILIDYEKFRKAMRKMMGMVINVEQSGRPSNAKQFIKEYAVLIPELKRIIKKNENVPKPFVFQFPAEKK